MEYSHFESSQKIYNPLLRKHYITSLLLIRDKKLGKLCGWGRSFWQQKFLGRCVTLPLCCNTTKNIEYLKDNGIFQESESSGSSIAASPNTIPFIIPHHLKLMPVQHWHDEDRIWLKT